MKQISIFLLPAIFAACGPGTVEGRHADPDEFAPVYAEMLILAAGPGSGHSTRMTQDSILASAGMSREQFGATVKWYNQDLTRWGDLLQRVVRYLEEKSGDPSGRGSAQAPGRQPSLR